MLSCSDLTTRSSPPACAAARFLRSSASRVGDLLLVHRLQEAIERGLREQQPQEQPQQPVEPGRADLLGAAADRRRRRARRRRSRASPGSARAAARSACARRPAARRASRRATAAAAAAGAAAGRLAGARGPSRRSPRGTAAPTRGRRGRSARPPPPAAAARARAASARRRPRRRGRTAGSTGRGTLPSGSRPSRRPAAAPCLDAASRGSSRIGHPRSVAGARRRRQAVDDVADLEDALDERRLAQHLLRRTVGGGTAISRRIVPGADENT